LGRFVGAGRPRGGWGGGAKGARGPGGRRPRGRGGGGAVSKFAV
jgi:hypothetical protein